MPFIRKFTPLIIYLIKKEGSQISDLKFYLKKLKKKKKDQLKLKVNRRQEIIKSRVEINDRKQKRDRKNY